MKRQLILLWAAMALALLALPAAALIDARAEASPGQLQRTAAALSWQRGSGLPQPAADGVAFVLGNSLYHGGGWSGDAAQPIRAVYRSALTNGQTGPWAQAGQLPHAGRFGAAAVVHAGRAYVLGGYDGQAILDRVDSFDGFAWRSERSLPIPLHFPAAAVVGDRLYVAGGQPGPSEQVWSARFYGDGSLSSWRAEASLPVGLLTRLAAGEGCLYVVGGDDGGELHNEVYSAVWGSDGRVERWARVAPLPVELTLHAVAVRQGTLYVLGGESGDESGTTELSSRVYAASIQPFCGLSGWTALDLPQGRPLERMAAAASGPGLYLVGGETASGYVRDTWYDLMSEPVLDASPRSLVFYFEGVTPPAQGVFISNGGGGNEFGWTAAVTEGSDWLSVAPASGTTPATLAVSVDPLSLSGGTYQGRIRIDADPGVVGTPQHVDVTLTVVVDLPRLGVSPAQLAFEMDQGLTNPPSQSVLVQNLGDGTPLDWWATPDVPWLEITPWQGRTQTRAWVEVLGEGLDSGVHHGHIVFDAGSVIGSPYSLPVTLTVRPPVMQVSPRALDFPAVCSPTVRSRMLAISQQGGGSDINWVATVVAPPGERLAEPGKQTSGRTPQATAQGWPLDTEHRSSVEWVSIAPESGTTPDIVHVQVDTRGLSIGQHSAVIVFVGSPVDVTDRVQEVTISVYVASHCTSFPLVFK